MKKARFTKEQQKVTAVTVDGMTTVHICLNGGSVDITNPETGEVNGQEYEYDFNEWIAPEDDVDFNTIKEDPESYLDYEPEKELTDSEKIEKALANSEYAVILAGGEV